MSTLNKLLIIRLFYYFIRPMIWLSDIKEAKILFPRVDSMSEFS